MSNDPVSIHIDRLAELLRGLGLDPVDMAEIMEVHVVTEGITVIRKRRDENGRAVAFSDETVTIRLDRSR